MGFPVMTGKTSDVEELVSVMVEHLSTRRETTSCLLEVTMSPMATSQPDVRIHPVLSSPSWIGEQSAGLEWIGQDAPLKPEKDSFEIYEGSIVAIVSTLVYEAWICLF